jgi:hypothetical protein
MSRSVSLDSVAKPGDPAHMVDDNGAPPPRSRQQAEGDLNAAILDSFARFCPLAISGGGEGREVVVASFRVSTPPESPQSGATRGPSLFLPSRSNYPFHSC